MSKLSSVLKKTGIAVAAAAMLVTMGAGTVVTQAKTSLPVYKVSLAKKYTNNQKGKQMEASVKIPKVKITGTDGKVMKSESEKLNAAISSYQNKFIKDYKKDVAAIKKGEKGNESLTSGYKVVTDNDKLFCLRIDTVIAMGGSQSYAKIFSVDKKSGKQITLKNLFKKGSGYIDRISDNIKEQMRAQMKENADVTYFVDDENSVDLFMGYAVAEERLQGQLSAEGIPVDAEHPLFVYLPCGVGGAPGGITFGLKLVYGDNVHVFYVEPVQCPCMLLGLATGLNSKICVQDVGLTGKTHADGLAVGRPSGFVGSVVRALVSGEFTIEDYRLYDLMRALLNTEDIFIEPSACACLPGPTMLAAAPGMDAYLTAHGLSGRMDNAAHVLWATGGRLVPEEIRNEYIKTRLK